MNLHQGRKAAAWRGKTHHCTVSAGNPTSIVSWCMLTTQGVVIHYYDHGYILHCVENGCQFAFLVSPFGSGCDNCNEWFHGHCINITEKMAKAIREWYCMRCRGEQKKKNFFISCQVLFRNIYDQLYKQTLSFYSICHQTNIPPWKSSIDRRNPERRKWSQTEPKDSTALQALRNTGAKGGVDQK